MTNLTVNQRNWLKKNKDNEPLIKKWLSKGPLHAQQVINIATGKVGVDISSRGIGLGIDGSRLEKGLEKGAVALQEMTEETDNIPEIDERALHIDGSAFTLAKAVQECGASLRRIFFLGQWCMGEGGEPDEIHDLIDYFADTDADEVHPSLRELKDALDEQGVDHIDVNAFFDLADTLGYYGFIAEVTVPRKSKFSKDGASYTCSWGSYYIDYVYGEDMEQLVEHAAQVVAEFEKEDRAREV